MQQRPGFALITVLWILVVTAAIAAAGAAAGFDAAAATKNRVNATRAYWHANACADRARFTVDRILDEAAVETRDSLWRDLGTLVPAAAIVATGQCSVRLATSGDRLNVNRASSAEIERLFEAMRLDSPQALTDALQDWIDPDQDQREYGAESAFYVSMTRRTPRNGPIASVAELRYIRGFEQILLDSVIGVDSARISLATAPLPVLASLPGFTNEILSRIAEWRASGRQVTNLLVLAGTVSSASANTMIASFPEIQRKSTVDPEAWLIVSQASAGYPPISASIELRLVRAQSRAALVGRRTW